MTHATKQRGCKPTSASRPALWPKIGWWSGCKPRALPDGTLQMQAQVEQGDTGTQEMVLFRLVNQGWLRAN